MKLSLVRCKKLEWMVSHHEALEEEVWWFIVGETFGDLFKTESALNQHGYHSMATASKLLTGCTYISIFVFGPKHTLPTLFHYIHKVFHFIFSSEIQHILCLNCSSYCFKQTGDCNCITFFYSLNKHKTQCHFRCLSVLYLLLHSYIQSLILWIFSVTFCCLPSDKDPEIAFV